MRSLFPTKWTPPHEPTYAEVEIVDQEAAHQAKWTQMAAWCWARDLYLAASIRYKKKMNYVKEEAEFMPWAWIWFAVWAVTVTVLALWR